MVKPRFQRSFVSQRHVDGDPVDNEVLMFQCVDARDVPKEERHA